MARKAKHKKLTKDQRVEVTIKAQGTPDQVQVQQFPKQDPLEFKPPKYTGIRLSDKKPRISQRRPNLDRGE